MLYNITKVLHNTMIGFPMKTYPLNEARAASAKLSALKSWNIS